VLGFNCCTGNAATKLFTDIFLGFVSKLKFGFLTYLLRFSKIGMDYPFGGGSDWWQGGLLSHG